MYERQRDKGAARLLVDAEAAEKTGESIPVIEVQEPPVHYVEGEPVPPLEHPVGPAVRP